MTNLFKKATKKQLKLRLLLEGHSGSGKTYSALLMAQEMGKKIALIDTEKQSASLYSHQFSFDVLELSPPFSPEAYIEAIKNAESHGYDVLIIDSITHEWSGIGGCLDIQNALGGRYQDWAHVSPRHNRFIDTILGCKMHIICTARTKTEHSLETDEDKNGRKKTRVIKHGLKAEQRDNVDYEFTTVLRLNHAHFYETSKDRTGLFVGKSNKLSAKDAQKLIQWLDDGEENLNIENQVSLDNEISIDHCLSYLAECDTLRALQSTYEKYYRHFKQVDNTDALNRLIVEKEKMKVKLNGGQHA